MRVSGSSVKCLPAVTSTHAGRFVCAAVDGSVHPPRTAILWAAKTVVATYECLCLSSPSSLIFDVLTTPHQDVVYPLPSRVGRPGWLLPSTIPTSVSLKVDHRASCDVNAEWFGCGAVAQRHALLTNRC